MKNKNRTTTNNILDVIGEDTIDYLPNQSILSSLLQNGIPILHECGGKARCSTCRILVVDGDQNITSQNKEEKLLRKKIKFSPNVRLACQTFLKGGEVRISRIMKDESDYDLYLTTSNKKKPKSKRNKIGEELKMALLFLDIRDFTPFVETHLAFDVVHLVRKLFSSFEGIIKEHQGEIVETSGDGMYVAFGFNTSIEKSANNAVQAGYKIFEKLKELNQTYFVKHFEERIRIGIGIHVGKVAVGKIDLLSNSHQIIMGYPVNIASRLEALTKELNNDFIISEDTFILLKHSPKTVKTVKTNLKGISSAFKIYLVGQKFK